MEIVWLNEKLLIVSKFFFYFKVFKCRLDMCQKEFACGKGFTRVPVSTYICIPFVFHQYSSFIVYFDIVPSCFHMNKGCNIIQLWTFQLLYMM